MKLDARMRGEPGLDRRALVRAQVVEDDMDGVVGGGDGVDLIKKADEPGGVALCAARPSTARDPRRASPHTGEA